MDCLQIIFIDDASTDSTPDILRNFEAHFPDQTLLLSLDQNQGQGYARNLALTYAIGTYVLYLDADDAIADYTAELLLKHADNSQSDILEFDFFRQEQPWLPKSEAFVVSLPSLPLSMLRAIPTFRFHYISIVLTQTTLC